MIFQEPMTSLNPVLTVGRQIGETLAHPSGVGPGGRGGARGRDAGLVGIPEPARRVREYPISSPRHAPARHDRDGAGMQSETADRRTSDTALDVTIQAQSCG